MNHNLKAGTDAFADYLQSVVKLEALQKLTDDLDEEIADSQRIMREIKTMYESIPNAKQNNHHQANNGLVHEDVSKFLECGVPNLLMSDMPENTVDVDLDSIISKMKTYAEDLKKNVVLSQPPSRNSCQTIETLNIDQYAASLDQLGKRLTNIKLNKKVEVNNRSTELEAKLTQLCDDVNMFTQMVQAKTTIGQCNDNWSLNQQDNKALYYDDIINKLLSGINEVTYLLQNKN